MRIEELYSKFLECTGVSTDTRNINEGQLFVALRGHNFNGNKYAKEAIAKGAKYALVDENIEGASYLKCQNTLESLQYLANHHRKRFNNPVIGLTGSNGKTTSKELIASVLATQFRTHFTKGNYNNHIGVPLTLLQLPLDSDIAIIEMGANHQKEIDQLSHIAEPNFGIITNIGKAHLEGFGGIEGVIKGKSELYDFIKKTKGKIIFNGDDELLEKQVANYSNTSTYYPSRLNISLDRNGYITISYDGVDYHLHLTGIYNVANIACALTCGLEFGIHIKDSLKAISNYKSNNNRSQIKNIGELKIVLDAYNANPTSMKASLSSFSKIDSDNKIIVLGEMLELGTVSLEEHQNIIDLVKELDLGKKIYLIGKSWEAVKTTFEKFENVEHFISQNTINSQKKTTLLFKGSRGVQLEKILEELT